LLAFPTLWVLGEWFRAWALTGFPWLFLGYTQMVTPLKGLAPLVSVYGVSWVLVFVSSLLLIFILSKRVSMLLSIFIFAALLWSICSVLTDIQWTKPNGAPIKVSLIQGDIPQEMKWQEEQAFASFNLYKKLTEQHLDSQLIVWPEAAITFTNFQAQDYIKELNSILKPHKITLISGIPFVDQQQRFYNAMIAIGNGQGTYFKRHLVPFGEFMPFRSILVWLKNYLEIPMSDFSRGPKNQTLIIANGIPVGSSICYEIAYPNEVLVNLPQSQLLVTVSDDSWFGDSFAPAQHVQMAQMRALETGRYLLMSTNNAVTAIINAQGKVESFAPPFQEYVLTGLVQPMVGSTPLVRIGILPIFMLFIGLLGIAYWMQRISLNKMQKAE
jgi:apolipoprotein N-acyltransferase